MIPNFNNVFFAQCIYNIILTHDQYKIIYEIITILYFLNCLQKSSVHFILRAHPNCNNHILNTATCGQCVLYWTCSLSKLFLMCTTKTCTRMFIVTLWLRVYIGQCWVSKPEPWLWSKRGNVKYKAAYIHVVSVENHPNQTSKQASSEPTQR